MNEDSNQRRRPGWRVTTAITEKSRPPLTGERRLALHLIEDTLFLLEDRSPDRIEWIEAANYILHPSPISHPFSFPFLCEALNLSLSAVQAQALKTIRRRYQQTRNRLYLPYLLEAK